MESKRISCSVSNASYNFYNILTTLLLSLMLTSFVKDVCSVRITSIKVPSYYVLDNHNDSEPLTLICEYDISDENDTRGLVVKWYKDGEAIYQWVSNPTTNEIKASPHKNFKSIIDQHKIESDDDNRQYRAIKFKESSINLSITGDYECSVQGNTLQATDKAKAHLEVIDMTNVSFKMETKTLDDDDDETLVICSVENVRPEPTLELKLNKLDEINIYNKSITMDDEGYDIIVRGNVSNSDIDSDTELGCLLSFEKTNFTQWFSDYNKSDGNIAVTIQFTFFLSTFILSTILRDYLM